MMMMRVYQLFVLIRAQVPHVYDAALVADHELRLVGVHRHSVHRRRHLENALTLELPPYPVHHTLS